MAGFDFTENATFDLRGLGAAATYTPTSSAWDCAIGGLPFIFGHSHSYPMQRGTADWRRPSQNTSGAFSEDSLDTGYWVRAQSSFHYGAGQSLFESLETDPDIVRFRFNTGGSVDPWTSGKIVPEVGVTAITTTSGTTPHALGTSSGVLYSNGTALSIGSTSLSSITWGGANTIHSITTDGTNYYAADNVGIYRGALPSTAGTKAFNLSANALVRWVKQRMIAAVGASLYEITNAQTASAAALPTALYTHPNTGWTWTDIAEGPDAIYAAGYAGSLSTIYRITVSVSGSTVTLNAPTVVAELPRGEVVNSLYTYLGVYVGVGTSKGVRLAQIESGGSLTMSPLQFSVTGGVKDMVGVDRFFYVAGGSATPVGDGTTGPGLYRLDLGTPLGNGLFAYAPAAAFNSAGSDVTGVTVGSNDFVYAALGSSTTGLVYLDTAATRATAWIVPPRIRMATTEQKIYKDIQIRGVTPGTSKIEAYASTTGTGSPSSWTYLGQLGSESDGFLSLAGAAAGPQDSLHLAFKLTPSGADVPEFYGYRLRAVPAVKRTRLVNAVLLCFDRETDRQGVILGQKGGAWERLSQLETLEETGDVVLWQDFTTGEARQAIIERVTQSRVAPPTRGQANAGGIVTVTLRLL